MSSVELAAAHTAMGQFDEALARLEDAFREGDRRLPTIATDPTFDPLRSEPRFKELVRRIRWGFRGVAPPPTPPGVRR